MKDQLLHRANFERPLITENQTGKYRGLVMVKPCIKLQFYCLFTAKIQQILKSKPNWLLVTSSRCLFSRDSTCLTVMLYIYMSSHQMAFYTTTVCLDTCHYCLTLTFDLYHQARLVCQKSRSNVLNRKAPIHPNMDVQFIFCCYPLIITCKTAVA